MLGHTFGSPGAADLRADASFAGTADGPRIRRRCAGGRRGERGCGAEDNERLEFLGDAVLNLVVAEALFELHPEWHEGELTRVRAQLVSRQHMAEVAAAIGLGEHLRLSKGEERSGLRHKSTVLSDSMEAVMGALFLDGGLEPVRAFARSQVMGEAVEQLAEELRSGAALGNYKSALQERLQAARTGTPVYRVKSESGPPHRRKFLVEVRIKRESGGAGRSRWPGARAAPRNMRSRMQRGAHWNFLKPAEPTLPPRRRSKRIRGKPQRNEAVTGECSERECGQSPCGERVSTRAGRRSWFAKSKCLH